MNNWKMLFLLLKKSKKDVFRQFIMITFLFN